MDTLLLCISDGWVTAIATSALVILTGVIAYYAYGAYEESKKSYQRSMKEITKDRIIGIIYNQLDRIENAIETFEINDITGTCHKGHAALLYLNSNLSKFYPVLYEGETEEFIINARKEINQFNLKLICLNNDQIYILSNRLYNAISIVKETLLQRELDIEEINRYKKLLFDNIGFIYMNVFKSIVENEDEFFDLFKKGKNDVIKSKSDVIDIKNLNMATVFLFSVINFEVAKFTVDNFESEKARLLK